MVTPYDVLPPEKSPYLNNARKQEQDVNSDGRRSAIRTKKGPGFYTVAVGETIDDTETSTTGADADDINTVHWLAQPFTPTVDGRLTKATINIRNPNGTTGNILLEVRSNNGGIPGDIIGTSSIPGSEISDTYTYEVFRFIEAPLLTGSTLYWLTAHLQEGGEGHYEWSTTTNTDEAFITDNSGGTWTSVAYSGNFEIYLSTVGGVKGLGRYYPTTNANSTIFAHGTDVYKTTDSTGAVTSIKSSLTSGATYYDFDTSQNKIYWANGVDVPMQYDNATVSNLGGSPSIADQLAFHKNRLFLRPTDDPTKLEFSDLGDYETWGATGFIYVPAPQTSDPIVKILSFQDSLAILNRNSKWILSGTDLSTFNLRQAIGKNGAVAASAVDSDENFVYYLGSDRRFYRWNGAEDTDIGWMVQPEFDEIPNTANVTVTCWKNQVRIYYAGAGQAFNNKCLIFDKVYEEWFRDTDAYIRHTALAFKDDNKLIEASDRAGVLYYAEQEDSNLGKPIEFEYRTTYHSFGQSGAKKQIRRLYPIFQSQTAPFEIELQVDKDFRDQPKVYDISTQGAGPLFGTAVYGTDVYGKTELIDPRITVSGQAVYFQIRFVHTGANQTVQLLGYVLYYRNKRPK